MTPPYPHAPYVHEQTSNASPSHPMPLIVHPDCSNASILTFAAPFPHAIDNIDTSSYSYDAIHVTSHYISLKCAKKRLIHSYNSIPSLRTSAMRKSPFCASITRLNSQKENSNPFAKTAGITYEKTVPDALNQNGIAE